MFNKSKINQNTILLRLLMSLKFKLIFKLFLISIFLFSVNCSKNNSKLDPNRPLGGKAKREKNIAEGRGASMASIIGKARGGTNYEFSSSNPMWRASLSTLDFLPLSTVDYSGGVVITDWYSENNSLESIKITLRFLSNEIRSDSVKVIVHSKKCSAQNNCSVSLKKSKISEELVSSILTKAAVLKKELKTKK